MLPGFCANTGSPFSAAGLGFVISDAILIPLLAVFLSLEINNPDKSDEPHRTDFLAAMKLGFFHLTQL